MAIIVRTKDNLGSPSFHWCGRSDCRVISPRGMMGWSLYFGAHVLSLETNILRCMFIWYICFTAFNIFENCLGYTFACLLHSMRSVYKSMSIWWGKFASVEPSITVWPKYFPHTNVQKDCTNKFKCTGKLPDRHWKNMIILNRQLQSLAVLNVLCTTYC